jgi:uncharacterized protein YqhQ
LLAIVGFLLALNIGFAEDINVTVHITEVPSFGIRATMLAIAQINPLAPLILVLLPIIIGEFLIRNFDEIKLNKPLEVAVRLLIILTAFALLAAVF